MQVNRLAGAACAGVPRICNHGKYVSKAHLHHDKARFTNSFFPISERQCINKRFLHTDVRPLKKNHGLKAAGLACAVGLTVLQIKRKYEKGENDRELLDKFQRHRVDNYSDLENHLNGRRMILCELAKKGRIAALESLHDKYYSSRPRQLDEWEYCYSEVKLSEELSIGQKKSVIKFLLKKKVKVPDSWEKDLKETCKLLKKIR